jgi:hypothetical protein
MRKPRRTARIIPTTRITRIIPAVNSREVDMTNKRKTILPLAAALGALSPALPATTAQAAISPQGEQDAASAKSLSRSDVNLLVSNGSDLLGFVVQKNADGTTLAQHYSHASHSSHNSHASHSSHFSSRY